MTRGALCRIVQIYSSIEPHRAIANFSRLGLLLILCLLATDVFAAEPASSSLFDSGSDWPTWSQWLRVLTLQDYNTRVVLAGAGMLGIAAGAIGSFTLLRKRALMGDALSHATLPGICLTFVTVTVLGGDGKSLTWLLLGGAATGVLGVMTILFIRRYSHIKEDSALGIVLSVFFGAGAALLAVATKTKDGNAAGLENFIYGKTASMVISDAVLIGIAGAIVTLLCALLFQPFKVLCFDAAYGKSRGLPVLALDSLMMALVVLVTIIGLQAVGLVLMIALLVIPAAAARFWTESMWRMTVVSALLGGISCLIGAGASALLPNLPSGATIVLVAAMFFLFSMVCGSARGLLIRGVRRHRLNRKVQSQHLLRAIYERLELADMLTKAHLSANAASINWQTLLTMRSWNRRALSREIDRAARQDWLTRDGDDRVQLTSAGLTEATRLVHQHRLWEMYLITHADIAPSNVDRDADRIEHVLDEQMIAKLERLLDQQQAVASPHPVALDGGAT